MALKLHAPGTLSWGKKGTNSKYQLQGTFEGRSVDVSCRTTDPDAAERFRIQFEHNLLDVAGPGGSPAAGQKIKFSEAADRYKRARQLERPDVARLERLKLQPEIQDKTLDDITQDDINAIAVRLFPDSVDSQIRSVYTPISGVLHYGAEPGNKWCASWPIKRPKPGKPRNRLPAPDAYARLMAAAVDPKQRLFIEWLFRQGRRISEYLQNPRKRHRQNSGILCERIDLREGTYETYISKSNHWQSFEMDEAVIALTRQDPDMTRYLAGGEGGPLFPWTNNNQVYRWFNPLCERVGLRKTKIVKTKSGHYIKYVVKTDMTPHRARHLLGTQLAADGTHAANIQHILGHLDSKSTERYVHADAKAIRAALKRRSLMLDNIAALPAKKERA